MKKRLAQLLCLLILSLGLAACGGEASRPAPPDSAPGTGDAGQSGETPEPDETPQSPWEDIYFVIDGETIQLPITFGEFSSRTGFVFDYAPQELYPRYFVAAKGDSQLYLNVGGVELDQDDRDNLYLTTLNSQVGTQNDSPAGINNGDTTFEINGGVAIGGQVDQAIAQFGEPTATSEKNNRTRTLKDGKVCYYYEWYDTGAAAQHYWHLEILADAETREIYTIDVNFLHWMNEIAGIQVIRVN